MREAMANIIINACEAMEDGGELQIEEATKEVDGLGNCVAISITDTGPGMPEEIKTKVFQPFFTTKDQGTGLGLSIANRIVHEHGGRIDLRTREGEGSTFTIYLPTLS
jgi:signal transduction histidine kinase